MMQKCQGLHPGPNHKADRHRESYSTMALCVQADTQSRRIITLQAQVQPSHESKTAQGGVWYSHHHRCRKEQRNSELIKVPTQADSFTVIN